MKEHYIIITGYKNTIIPDLIKALEGRNDVTVLKGNVILTSRISRFLYRLHHSVKINKIINLPLKGLWLSEKRSFFSGYPYDADTQYYLIIFNMAMNTINPGLLNTIRANKIKKILIFTDMVSDKKASGVAFRCREKFDCLMTFDLQDAATYGMEYFLQVYSRYDIEPGVPMHDLFFLGRDKGRKKLLFEIAEYMEKLGLTPDFNIIHGKKTDSRINYMYKTLPYVEALQKTLKSRGILEIVQQGQTGATARYMEAVCYNKILITNNDAVINFPFYDERFIHIFHKAEDIQREWFSEGESVEYNYNDECSPNALLSRIKEHFS